MSMFVYLDGQRRQYSRLRGALGAGRRYAPRLICRRIRPWLHFSRDLYMKSLDGSSGWDMYDGRHDSLRFLAWLLGGWPHGVGPQVAQEMLMLHWYAPIRRSRMPFGRSSKPGVATHSASASEFGRRTLTGPRDDGLLRIIH